jgi:hypothetical protein
MFRWCVKWLRQGLHPIIESLNECYKQWTRPDTGSLVMGTLIDVTRSKRDLIAENAFLKDRGWLVLLASVCRQRAKRGRDKQAVFGPG